jgi:hypothetical protein
MLRMRRDSRLPWTMKRRWPRLHRWCVRRADELLSGRQMPTIPRCSLRIRRALGWRFARGVRGRRLVSFQERAAPCMSGANCTKFGLDLVQSVMIWKRR